MAKMELQTREFKQFAVVGSTVEGVVEGFFQIPTQYGMQQCIELSDPAATGSDNFCIGCTANLALYLPQIKIGMHLRFTWVKNEKNPKTKNTYRVFEIDVISERSPSGPNVNLDDDIPF